MAEAQTPEPTYDVAVSCGPGKMILNRRNTRDAGACMDDALRAIGDANTAAGRMVLDPARMAITMGFHRPDGWGGSQEAD
jgi:hypothetical protein